jgi:hypothetical protein
MLTDFQPVAHGALVADELRLFTWPVLFRNGPKIAVSPAPTFYRLQSKSPHCAGFCLSYLGLRNQT